MRTITTSWEDPRPAFERGKTLSGLDYLRLMQSGELPPPPIARLLGFRLAVVEPGIVVFEGEPGEQHYNPIGVVHGGLAATLLDSAMGCAVHSTLPAGAAYTTLEIKVNYIRAMSAETGLVRARGSIIHAGRSTATADGRLEDGAGKLLAHATTTCIVLRR
jgi:uncharacterized protein (TIGR00369 family)